MQRECTRSCPEVPRVGLASSAAARGVTLRRGRQRGEKWGAGGWGGGLGPAGWGTESWCVGSSLREMLGKEIIFFFVPPPAGAGCQG